MRILAFVNNWGKILPIKTFWLNFALKKKDKLLLEALLKLKQLTVCIDLMDLETLPNYLWWTFKSGFKIILNFRTCLEVQIISIFQILNKSRRKTHGKNLHIECFPYAGKRKVLTFFINLSTHLNLE